MIVMTSAASHTHGINRKKKMSSYPDNLPLQLSHFIGREQAMDDIKRAVWTTRLLTLVGGEPCHCDEHAGIEDVFNIRCPLC